MLVLAALPVIGVTTGSAVAGILFWGAAAWASTSAQQIRVASLAPGASDVLLSLNQSVMQIAIAIGAGGGGLVAAHTLTQLPLIAAAGVAASLVLLVIRAAATEVRTTHQQRLPSVRSHNAMTRGAVYIGSCWTPDRRRRAHSVPGR